MLLYDLSRTHSKINILQLKHSFFLRTFSGIVAILRLKKPKFEEQATFVNKSSKACKECAQS